LATASPSVKPMSLPSRRESREALTGRLRSASSASHRASSIRLPPSSCVLLLLRLRLLEPIHQLLHVPRRVRHQPCLALLLVPLRVGELPPHHQLRHVAHRGRVFDRGQERRNRRALRYVNERRRVTGQLDTRVEWRGRWSLHLRSAGGAGRRASRARTRGPGRRRKSRRTKSHSRSQHLHSQLARQRHTNLESKLDRKLTTVRPSQLDHQTPDQADLPASQGFIVYRRITQQ